MDDGQRVKSGGITLCTDSYSTSEISILRDALKLNFNLETSIHNSCPCEGKSKGKKGKDDIYYERIYIKKEGFEEIKPSLIPHMHDSMLYKLNITADQIAENSQIEEKAVFNFCLCWLQRQKQRTRHF